MWNFKRTLWNPTQNIIPIHWKIWFSCNVEILRAFRLKRSYAILKQPPGTVLSVAVHDNITKWKHFPHYWPFVRGIHWSPVDSPHKGQWCRALMFSFICAWTKGLANNRDTSDLKRHHVHYDVTVNINTSLPDMEMFCEMLPLCQGIPPDTGYRWTPSQRPSNAGLWCHCVVSRSTYSVESFSCTWHKINFAPCKAGLLTTFKLCQNIYASAISFSKSMRRPVVYAESRAMSFSPCNMILMTFSVSLSISHPMGTM